MRSVSLFEDILYDLHPFADVSPHLLPLHEYVESKVENIRVNG